MLHSINAVWSILWIRLAYSWSSTSSRFFSCFLRCRAKFLLDDNWRGHILHLSGKNLDVLALFLLSTLSPLVFELPPSPSSLLVSLSLSSSFSTLSLTGPRQQRLLLLWTEEWSPDGDDIAAGDPGAPLSSSSSDSLYKKFLLCRVYTGWQRYILAQFQGNAAASTVHLYEISVRPFYKHL